MTNREVERALAEDRAACDRRCLATGEIRPKIELIRFVVDPDGRIVPDVAGRLPGRGYWVGASRADVEKAAAKGLFARAVRAKVTVSKTLADEVAALLRRRCLDGIGLMRRSGVLVAGMAKVLEAIAKDCPAARLEAADGSADGRSKVDQAMRRTYGEKADTIPLVGCFSSEEIGLALGREVVVHACARSAGVTERWLQDVSRLGGFLPLIPDNWRGGSGTSGNAGPAPH